jgi:hypothetical protein
MLAPDPEGLIDLAQPHQKLLLVNMVRDIRPALVVVDSLAAATGHAETSIQGACALLGFLSAIACQGRLALLLIHHLRKRARSGQVASAPQVVADDLHGSSHISAAARSALALSLVSPLASNGSAASPFSPAPGSDWLEAKPPSPDATQVVLPAASGAQPEAQVAAATAAPLRQSHLDGPRRLEVGSSSFSPRPERQSSPPTSSGLPLRRASLGAPSTVRARP